jgi:hypothetical protein
MEPNATTNAGTPAQTTPAGAGVQGSASGPGSSGVGGGSGTPNPTPAVTPNQSPAAGAQPAGTPGFNAASSPATQAAAAAQGQAGQAGATNIVPAAQPPQYDFDGEFQKRYGVHPSQAQLLMQMGYRQYVGQQQAALPAQAGQAQPQAHPWGIPQFDERLLQYVEKDPATGQLRVLPGGPPDAAIQVQKYHERR